jgi:hypothetical protein
MIVVNGQVVGIWQRALKKGSAIISPAPFRSLTGAENQALLEAATQCGAFLGLPVTVT